jgi:hypothetical protein
MNSLIDNITRENIQRRYEEGTRLLFSQYLDQLEGLTNDAIYRILENDRDLSIMVIRDFCIYNETDYTDEHDSSVNVGEYLNNLLEITTENPVRHICNNTIDDVVRPFIQTTKSSILERHITYTDTDTYDIFVNYITSIMYWFGNPWLLEWCRSEIQRRMTETDDEPYNGDEYRCNPITNQMELIIRNE